MTEKGNDSINSRLGGRWGRRRRSRHCSANNISRRAIGSSWSYHGRRGSEAIGIGALGVLNEGLQKHGISEGDATYYDERIMTGYDERIMTGATLISVDLSVRGMTGERVRAILYRNSGHSSTHARTASGY